MGPAMRPNAGIGSGFAKGTEDGQADFRRATFCCEAPGCHGLVDVFIAWKAAGTRQPNISDGCTACGPSRARKQSVQHQRAMAMALELGERRLVYRTRHLVVRSDAARRDAVRAARVQADAIDASATRRRGA